MIPGLENARVRAARRPASQHLHQLARSCSTAQLRLKADPRAALCRPDHRRRGLCRKSRRSGCSPGASPRRAAWARDRRRRRRRRRWARWSTTSPAGIWRRRRWSARSFQPMNVNFGLFPPLAAPPPRGKVRAAQGARAEARACRARARRSRPLAGLSCLGRRGVVAPVGRLSRYNHPNSAISSRCSKRGLCLLSRRDDSQVPVIGFCN